MYKSIIRPLLFRMNPEAAHHFTFNALKVIFAIPGVQFIAKQMFVLKSKSLEKEIMGLKFPNPIGLAAGFDNEGVQVLRKRLENRPSNIIVGGNIGKNKATPNEDALSDYEICFEELYPVVDYFVVNVSSPNTPGLRALQEREPLTKLLQRLSDLNQQKKPKPLLLKIAPDLTNEQLDEIVDIVKTVGLVIIGVGGIFNADDAKEKLEAGADLLQVYTGFIYEGPGMVKKILSGLLR